jgi:hypothetical protein
VPSAWVSGRVTLRPIRLGLVIDPSSINSLMRAIERATSFWGGVYYPIFDPSNGATIVVRQAEAFDVDCLVAVGDDPSATALTETPGFQWQNPMGSALGHGALARGAGTHSEHPMPASALYEWYRANRHPYRPASMVTWDRDDERDHLLTAWFGRFGHTPAERLSDALMYDTADPLSLQSSFPPHPMMITTQLDVTREDINFTRGWPKRGVAVIDPSDVGDLRAFWNLRAAGNTVFPWCERWGEEMTPRLGEWIRHLRPSVTTAGDPGFHVWARGRVVPAEIQPLLSEDSLISTLDVDYWSTPGLTTRHVSQFNLDVDPSTSGVRVVVPQLDFLPRLPDRYGMGMVAANGHFGSDGGTGSASLGDGAASVTA